MRRWLFSLACLSFFFPSALPAVAQAGHLDDASNSFLPFRVSAGYLIEVEGQIGDQAHLKFILDTGASISIVGERVAQKLKLDARPAQSFNFYRNLQWETATLPEVQLGPIRAANVTVLVGDLARYSAFAGKADAILGMDLLRLKDFTVVFGTDRLIFDPGPSRAYLAGGDPISKCLIAEVQVQGRPVRVIVDTGLQGVLLYEERLRRSVPGLRTAGSIKNVTLGGRVPARQATLPDVVVGNRNRTVAVLLLQAPGEEALPGIVGIVGIDVFQARWVHFDFSGNRLSWK